MANYENGASTRQAIVDACEKLFYEKGFHETSYYDICETAHVNRGTIYYHFETKEDLRYAVLGEYTLKIKRIAERYCMQPEYHYILAAYMIYFLIKSDRLARKFFYDLLIDYAVYSGEKNCTRFYSDLNIKMWKPFYSKAMISDLAFASVYGYIASCMRMLCEHPEKYDPFELFEHCTYSSIAIWGIPKERIYKIKESTRRYIDLIPEEEIVLRQDG